MPDQAVFRVDVGRAGLRVDRAALAAALAALPAGAPVVVMIHGYRFAPGARGGNCPHTHIFSMQPPVQDWTAISWPRHLGLSGGRALAIGFGWPARGRFRGACVRARRAGRALAELAALVQCLDPGRTFDVVGHSLGARVALAALPYAEAGDLRRLILLAAAETRRPAMRAMSSAAGRCVQVVNVTTRENDLFDFLFEWLAGAGLDTAIGQGLRETPANWLDLQLDQPASLAALARLGHALPEAPARISHWSPYLRPGALGLYRAILDGSLALGVLRNALPERRDPRWSRLLAGWRWPMIWPVQRV
ncbi:alpha/beta fold hydrolase [Cypionkella psychrotolerans]|uniref:alpha/beta fold hydrolase n=1 Tax=Cypionkella psychrotolerans TaxID=1678131 RepID=UPI0006B4E3C3|nr:alpha/beta fold hydrolase [Cypionkella psychrotolerans]